MFLVSCGSSPEKLLDKGDNYLDDSNLEKALITYQKVLEDFPNDTLAHQAQYNIAWIEIDKKLNYKFGLEILENIADGHPELESGKAASNDIDNIPRWLISKTNELRKDTTKTVDDAMNAITFLIDNYSENPLIPEALYLKGNIYLNDKNDYYRAINTYQEIIHKYKGTNFEPMSKFMIGYVYANIMNDYKKAEINYSEFLEEFPEHELVPSVKFELEYLGKQINDVEDLKSEGN